MLFQVCLLWTLLCPQTPEKPPTLAETTQFLAEKLPELGIYTGKSASGYNYKIKITEAKADSCNFEFTMRTELSKNIRSVYMDTFKIPLGLLDGEKIALVPDSEGPKEPVLLVLRLPTKGDKELIEQIQLSQDNGARPGRARGMVSYASIKLESKEAAARLTKAFQHAVKLCAEKKEPF